MTEELHIELHRQHRRWASDLDMWLEDLKIWNEELEALNNSLIYIGKSVEQHEEGLEAHRKLLEAHRSRFKRHEIDITYLPEGSRLDNELRQRHIVETDCHQRQQEAHDRLKKFHHKIMVLTKELRKGIEVLDY